MQTLQWLFQKVEAAYNTAFIYFRGLGLYRFSSLYLFYFTDKASEGKAFQYFRVNSTCQTPPRTR